DREGAAVQLDTALEEVGGHMDFAVPIIHVDCHCALLLRRGRGLGQRWLSTNSNAPSVPTATPTLVIGSPWANRESTSADNSGSNVRVKMFSTFRAPDVLSVQRAATLSTRPGAQSKLAR